MEKKTPAQIIYQQIITRVNAQKDRWNCGMSNIYFQWEDFKSKYEEFFAKELKK